MTQLHKSILVVLLVALLPVLSCTKDSGFAPTACGVKSGGCNDNNPCTKDFCDTSLNRCVFKPIQSYDCLPRIVIEEPTRAKDIQSSQSVTIKGRALSGHSPIQELKINGNFILVQDDNTFELTITPQFGMNLIVAEAKDKSGASTQAVQTFFHSTQWVERDPHAPELSNLPEALHTWLGRYALDDNNHDFNDVNDLATATEIIVSHTELQGLPSPEQTVSSVDLSAAGLGTFDIYLQEVRLGSPTATLSAQDGGIHMTLLYDSMEADLEFRQPGLTVGSVIVYPALASSSPLILNADVGVSTGESQALEVQASNTTVQLANFNLAFDLEDDTLEDAINAVINIDLIKSLFTSEIEQNFETQLSTTLEDLVTTFIGPSAFELDSQFPPILGSNQPTPVQFKVLPTTAQFTSLGGKIGLDATVLSDRAIYYPTLGSISKSGCLLQPSSPPPWFDPSYTVQFAVHDDYINQMLFALWWGGGFQFPLSDTEQDLAPLSRLGITDLSVDVDLLHPPIVSSCNSENALRIQIGDMKLRLILEIANSELVNLDVYTSLEADMEFKIIPTDSAPMVGLNLTQIRQLETEVALDDPSLAKHRQALQDFVETVFISAVIENLATSDSTTFPLPPLDLSIVQGVPPGYELELDLQKITHVDDYTLIQGHFE